MMQHRIRSIDHEFSELSDLHAVVDIIECDGKFLRKSAHGVKYGAFAHHAGRRDGAVILSAHCPVEVAVLGFVEPDKRVSRNASESDDNAGMLDRIILIEKSCADNSDVLSLGKAEHLLDKVLCDQLDIVVHEQKVFALCMLYAEVVDRGIVELPLPADNVYIREFLLDLLIVSPCRLFCAVVLHDDKLEVLVRPFRQHRADTVVEIDSVVLVRDDHGDKRISLDLKCRVINAVVHAFFHFFRLDPHSLIVVHDRAGTGCEGVKLALRVARRGIRMAAPVV